MAKKSIHNDNLQGKMLANLFLGALHGSLASDVQNLGSLEILCVHVLLKCQVECTGNGCFVIVSAVIL